MERKVQISDESGRVVSIDDVNLTAVNYQPVDQEWFDLAWENAVEDGLVNDEDRSKYKITFA